MRLPASSTGVVNTANVFDEWGVNVGGTLTLCHATNGSGGGWASDSGTNTARGTGYSQLDASGSVTTFISNTNSLTHCYNGGTDLGPIAANQATHFGTFYTTAAGQTSWQYGVTGATPTPGCFCIWNTYNRVDVATQFGDNSSSWQYTHRQSCAPPQPIPRPIV